MACCINTNPSAATLDLFRSLRGKGGHFERGLFIAEAPKVVRKFLESSYEIPYAYLTESYFEHFRSLLEEREGNTEVIVASKDEMEKVVGYALHQGVMIAGKIPESPSLSSILVPIKPQVIIALDSIADAENMGGIIRSAAAFEAALVVDDQSCHPFLRRSIRVSMGTITDVPLVRAPRLETSLLELKREGFRIVAAALSDKAHSIYTSDFTGKICLVFGAEGWGIRKEILACCDETVLVPMNEKIDSLNVGVAAGIFLYECSRQNFCSTQ